MKILLSGTPITNGTPLDLVHPLMVLGKLEAVLKAAGVYVRPGLNGPQKAFRNKFMSYSSGKWTPNMETLPLLNDALRQVCYLRREKSQVLLDLPPLQRNTDELELNGALDEYRRAEDDIRAYLFEKGGRKALDSFERAAAIVQINNLRRLAGEAKTEAAIEWIKDFFISRPDAQLVVFANHKKVQTGIVEAFPGCVWINSGKTAQPKVDAFQEGKVRLAVCSLGAAREGITLTAADTVLMVEQGWTPMESDQAEARIHRPGQEGESVEARYLLAAHTYDVHLFDLINRKRDVERLAAVGEVSADDDYESTYDMMMEYLGG